MIQTRLLWGTRGIAGRSMPPGAQKLVLRTFGSLRGYPARHVTRQDPNTPLATFRSLRSPRWPRLPRLCHNNFHNSGISKSNSGPNSDPETEAMRRCREHIAALRPLLAPETAAKLISDKAEAVLSKEEPDEGDSDILLGLLAERYLRLDTETRKTVDDAFDKLCAGSDPYKLLFVYRIRSIDWNIRAGLHLTDPKPLKTLEDLSNSAPEWFGRPEQVTEFRDLMQKVRESLETAEKDLAVKTHIFQLGPTPKPGSGNFRAVTFKMGYLQLLFAAGCAYLLLSDLLLSEDRHELSWQEFRAQLLDTGQVARLIVVNKQYAQVVLNEAGVAQHGDTVYYFTIGSVESLERRLEEAQAEDGINSDAMIPVAYVSKTSIWKVLGSLLPTLLMIGGLVWITRKVSEGAGLGGGIFGVGKSKAKVFNQGTTVNVKFKDVAGMDEAKEEVMEFVKFLKDPKKYEKLGAKIPRGAILSGPPGTGKTLLAKATAGEAGVPFFSVSGSEFVEMFVGVGASRVRDLFQNARKAAPSIIFVDEIDAIGKSRSKNKMSGANDEREATLNQLLVEMDGFSTSDHVVVLAGTNRPDVLDPALLRPGRFDRHVQIDKPDLDGRKAIFKVHLKKIRTNEDLEDLAGRLAVLTPGFSGADIANCVNEAALIAARYNADSVVVQHFEQAIERVVGGLEKKSNLLSPEEKKIVAYHEAGHAICGWFLEFADPLLKVSIIPRGQGALGYAMYVPPDLYLMSEQQLMDKMTMTLGGRVSEEIHFDSVTSGGHDDFKKVTRMARAMVTSLGMSDKIGWVNFEKDGEQFTKPFSEETGAEIDDEIRRFVKEAHERCIKLLTEKKKEVGLVAEELLAKEVIGREDMIRLLGKRPFPDRNDAFDKYLNEKEQKEKKGEKGEKGEKEEKESDEKKD